MISITSDLDLNDTEAVRQAVSQEVQKLDNYLLRQGMQATNRMESTMMREYLHAKLRGKIDEEEGR